MSWLEPVCSPLCQASMTKFRNPIQTSALNHKPPCEACGFQHYTGNRHTAARCNCASYGLRSLRQWRNSFYPTIHTAEQYALDFVLSSMNMLIFFCIPCVTPCLFIVSSCQAFASPLLTFFLMCQPPAQKNGKYANAALSEKIRLWLLKRMKRHQPYYMGGSLSRRPFCIPMRIGCP